MWWDLAKCAGKCFPRQGLFEQMRRGVLPEVAPA